MRSLLARHLPQLAGAQREAERRARPATAGSDSWEGGEEEEGDEEPAEGSGGDAQVATVDSFQVLPPGG